MKKKFETSYQCLRKKEADRRFRVAMCDTADAAESVDELQQR
jgi:hypothetical protein